MLHQSVILFFMVALGSLSIAAADQPGVDPFFGVQERKPRKTVMTKRTDGDVLNADKPVPFSKILAGVGMFVFLAGGITMIGMAARQSKQASEKHSQKSAKLRRSDRARFKLNEPYSENKNPLTKLVDPIRRNFEPEPSDSLIHSDEKSPAHGVDQPIAAIEPNMVASNAELESTGIADVVDAELPIGQGASEPVKSQEVRSDLADETITSVQKLVLTDDSGSNLASPPSVEMSLSQAETVEQLRPVGSTAGQSSAFDAITETKPRLISADDQAKTSKSSPNRRKKRPSNKGGSDVA